MKKKTQLFNNIKINIKITENLYQTKFQYVIEFNVNFNRLIILKKKHHKIFRISSNIWTAEIDLYIVNSAFQR